MRSGDYHGAIAEYARAIDLTAKAPYLGNRAAAYMGVGEFDLAVGDCERALAIDPAYTKAYARLG